jgi:hypothetical protein
MSDNKPYSWESMKDGGFAQAAHEFAETGTDPLSGAPPEYDQPEVAVEQDDIRDATGSLPVVARVAPTEIQKELVEEVNVLKLRYGGERGVFTEVEPRGLLGGNSSADGLVCPKCRSSNVMQGHGKKCRDCGHLFDQRKSVDLRYRR